MGHSAERKPAEAGVRADAGDLAPGAGNWRSTPETGAKVCAVWLDTVHLAHSGLPEGWTEAEAEAFFVDSAHLAVETPEGAMRPRTVLPHDVESWIEVVRYAQRELWDGTPGMGTSVVLSA